MKKYQIVESYGTHMHAGSKATNDCVNILEELDFEKIEIVRHKPEDKSPVSKIIRQLSFYKQFVFEVFLSLFLNHLLIAHLP